MYASSITNKACGAAAIKADKRSRDIKLPVGLLGLAMKTMLGDAIVKALFSASSDKSHSASSGTSSTRKPRQRALIRYMTNDGVVVSTVAISAGGRGLTKAVSNKLMTSS